LQLEPKKLIAKDTHHVSQPNQHQEQEQQEADSVNLLYKEFMIPQTQLTAPSQVDLALTQG